MFAFKNKYFFIIENIKDIDLRNIKITGKYNLVYRNENIPDKIEELLAFRKVCKSKKIDFYVSNHVKLAKLLKADGIYLSSHNKDLSLINIKKTNMKMIGSAHNIKEINIKKLQGCSDIIFSRLFKTSYPNKKGFLGVVRFNLLKISIKENLVPLGGIRIFNLNKTKLVMCNSIAISSEIKKKPAKIISRLF